MRTTICCLAIAIVALSPRAGRAQAPASDTASSKTYFDFQVEVPVKARTPVKPVYPSNLRSSRIGGEVLVQFIVDERGNADMNSFKVLRSTDNEFSESVRRAVRASSYHPAEVHGRKVKQLVQQPFMFAR
ncbi:MAG TPA: energy transducer TonB [Gemmatimonadaceae bacterium]|nr:energy transducer TonB [Gemmatimonadaceae bacterium]